MTPHLQSRPRQTGYALVMALVFVAISLLLLTSMLQRTSGSTSMTHRNNDYNRAVGAAEAATEKVLSQINSDFINQKFNPANLGAYRSLIPTTDWAAEYEFSDGAGAVNQTWVSSSPTAVLTNLDSQFAGLDGRAFLCTVRANAKSLTTTDPELTVAVRQDFQLASIPLFQFAIYYALDLEITPPNPRIINGKVHGGANIYSSPSSTLVFADTVGAVGKIYDHRHPDDPLPPSVFTPVYKNLRQEKISSLTLPVGSDNSPVAVRQILDPPFLGEDPNSPLGKQRYYNKADLIITTTTNAVMVQVKNGNSVSTIAVPTFLNPNATFYDYRESKSVIATELDVRKLKDLVASDSTFAAVKCIYVHDQRSTADKLAAVLLVNGQSLPTNGLTVATPQPLYVKGNYNAPDLTPGTTNTSAAKSASLVGDSLTVLSANWSVNGTNSASMLDRKGADTTINAAIIAGIVPTSNINGIKHYSGGMDNLIRLLESWNGYTLTYNGSMVVLFPSRYATSYWASDVYYNAPLRKWAFDANFLNWNKLPPGTPQAQKLVRSRWNVVSAESPN